VLLVVLGNLIKLVKRVVQLLLELEKCEMEARAYRMSLHFSARALASGRCADDGWLASGALTSALAAVTSSPA
jgi:hypothetical protein